MTRVTFEGLELYEWKLSCTVLKGEEGRNALDLPGGETKNRPNTKDKEPRAKKRQKCRTTLTLDNILY